MHHIVLSGLLASGLLAATLAAPAAAQQSQAAPPAQVAARPVAPHAWLFGAWTGGLFPPPVTLSAQECLANPTVIFTRDAVLRASPTDVTYQQSLVETVRAVPGGVEFRLAHPVQPATDGGAFGLNAPAPSDAGFGCDPSGLLRVQRRGEDQIGFPACPQFPYPLIRCPSH